MSNNSFLVVEDSESFCFYFFVRDARCGVPNTYIIAAIEGFLSNLSREFESH